ncbi:DUF2470 domain-containing protein [Streptomyces nitrosporeus]|uniref:DUF2470 domain-containing protein n=1 Tax=Streptomyces nitrosporeus TaxID=28894 RepID=UPI0033303662
MPSAAERTRTLVQSTCSAVLLVPGLDAAHPGQLMPESRAVGPEGDLLLCFATGSPVVRAAARAGDGELPAVLELTDVAPVSVPHRIRGRARIAGWLTALPGLAAPGRTMLRLEVSGASVDDLWGAREVEPEDLRDAGADPLAAHEAELLQHLHTAHAEQMASLSALLGERSAGRGPLPRAVPLALDRFGLRVRFVEEAGTCFDARFDFPGPVRDAAGLQRALYTLFEAAAC